MHMYVTRNFVKSLLNKEMLNLVSYETNHTPYLDTRSVFDPAFNNCLNYITEFPG